MLIDKMTSPGDCPVSPRPPASSRSAAIVSTPAMAQQAEEQYFGGAEQPRRTVLRHGHRLLRRHHRLSELRQHEAGGVNGVKLTYEECETEYNAARTVECYQRLLNKGDQKMVRVRYARHAAAPMP